MLENGLCACAGVSEHAQAGRSNVLARSMRSILLQPTVVSLARVQNFDNKTGKSAHSIGLPPI